MTWRPGLDRTVILRASAAFVCVGVLAANVARAAGPVVGWVGSEDPPASVNGTAGSATAIAAGLCHSCAIQSGTGAVVCWGGNVEYASVTPPPAVDGTAGTASAIAAGGYFYSLGEGYACAPRSCAIQSATNAVVCWGSGGTAPPASVDGRAGTATAISVGWSHSCAIQAETGAVVCWGGAQGGAHVPPFDVNGTDGTASAIAAGPSHSCAIQSGTRAVVCWGAHTSGQATPPPSVDGTDGTASAIAVGGGDSCAIQSGTGAVVCWGWGQFIPPPSVDGTAGGASAIAVGYAHSLAIQRVPRPPSPWGCGLGPELALLLAPLWWLRRRAFATEANGESGTVTPRNSRSAGS